MNRRKATAQLGALLLCHITYHQTMSDLTRIGLTENSSLVGGQPEYSAEQSALLATIQDQCFEHNMALCAIFEEAVRHGPETLADTWLSIVAHDSVRVVVHYISMGLGSSKEKGESLRSRAVAAVHSNIRALKSMIPIHSLAQSLVSGTEKGCFKILKILATDNEIHRSTPRPLIRSSERACLSTIQRLWHKRRHE